MAKQALTDAATQELWDSIEEHVRAKLKRARRKVAQLERAIVEAPGAEGLIDDQEAFLAEVEVCEAYLARNFGR